MSHFPTIFQSKKSKTKKTKTKTNNKQGGENHKNELLTQMTTNNDNKHIRRVPTLSTNINISHAENEDEDENDSQKSENLTNSNSNSNGSNASASISDPTYFLATLILTDEELTSKIRKHKQKLCTNVYCLVLSLLSVFSLFLFSFAFLSTSPDLYSNYEIASNTHSSECYLAYKSSSYCNTNYAIRYSFTFRADLLDVTQPFKNTCREISYDSQCMDEDDENEKLNSKYSQWSLEDKVECYIYDKDYVKDDDSNSDSDSDSNSLFGDSCSSFLKWDMRDIQRKSDAFIVCVCCASLLSFVTLLFAYVYFRRFRKYDCYASLIEFNEDRDIIRYARNAHSTQEK